MRDKLTHMKEATLCFLTTEEEVVLAEMQSGPFKGHINGYGGKIEQGESILQAMTREMEEECGVSIRPEDIERAAVIDFYNFRENAWQRVRVYTSIARVWNGVPRAGDGMGLPEQFPHSALPFSRMLPSDRLWLPRILRGELLEGQIWHTRDFTGFEKEPIIKQIPPERLVELWKLS